MKLKNTLLLLLIAMGAFAYIWFVERHQKSTRQLAEDGNLVAQFDRDDVNTINIRSTEGKIELKEDAKGTWQIVEPIQDRADSMAVAQLFTEAEALKYVERIDDEGKGVSKERLKEFGLSDSKVRVRFTGKEKPVEFLWGKDAATEGKQYLKVDGSSVVYVVGGPLKTTLTRRLDDFRDRKLGDVSATQVNKVTVKTSAGEIELTKDNSNQWALVKPLKARGDNDRIGDLISKAANARIESFVGDAANLSAYGLQEPRVTVTLFTAEGPPVALDLGTNPKDEKDKDRTYAKLSTRNAVVLLPKAIESLMTIKPNDLRDRTLARVQPDIVDRVTIEGPGVGEKVVLARSGESWVRKVGDKELPANADAAQAIVGPFIGQQVADFVADVATDLPKYGLDRPSVKVTLSSYASENTAETKAGEKPIVSVLIGKIEADKVFAKLDDEPFIVSLPMTVLDGLPTDPLAWQPTEIFNDKADDVVVLEVIREGQPTVGVELDKEKKWKLSKGDGAVNQNSVGSLVNTLAGLRAVRWVGATTPEHGLEKPTMTVSYKTAARSGKLHLGAATPDEMWYAKADGLTGTFLVSGPDKTAFELPLMEKSVAPAATATPAGAPPAANPPPTPPTVPAPVQDVPAVPLTAPMPTEAPTQPATPPKP